MVLGGFGGGANTEETSPISDLSRFFTNDLGTVKKQRAEGSILDSNCMSQKRKSEAILLSQRARSKRN